MRSVCNILALGLVLVLLTSDAAQARSTRDCESDLKVIERALEVFAREHGGRYPGSLYLLVPDYLTVLPVCSNEEGNTYAAGYRTTADHRWFGVVCVAHQRHLPYAGLSHRSNVKDRPNHSVEACKRELLAARGPVEFFLRTRGRLPKTVSECVKTDTLAARSMAVVPLSAKDYQIICLDLHLDREVAPLSPRYDSRKGQVLTDQLFIAEEPDAQPAPSRLSLLGLGLLILSWLGYRAKEWELFQAPPQEIRNTSVPHLIKLKTARVGKNA